MGSFSLIHWIILGVVILLLFGGNRFSAMMSDVAKGLKNFKQGLSEDDKPAERDRNDPRQLPPQSSGDPIDVTPRRTPDPVPPPPTSDEPNRD
jgi:sec-independent protein translocase protein TatA